MTDQAPAAPVNGADPASAPPPLILLSPEMMPDGVMLAMDAAIAEGYFDFERRKIRGKWHWREARRIELGDAKQPWLEGPPAIVRDNSIDAVRVLDIVAMRLHQTWRLGTVLIGLSDSQKPTHVAYLAELGRLRAVATTPGLACGDVIARTLGSAVDRMVDELREKH